MSCGGRADSPAGPERSAGSTPPSVGWLSFPRAQFLAAAQIVDLFALAGQAPLAIHILAWQAGQTTRSVVTVHPVLCCEFRLTTAQVATGPEKTTRDHTIPNDAEHPTGGQVTLAVHPLAALERLLISPLAPEPCRSASSRPRAETHQPGSASRPSTRRAASSFDGLQTHRTSDVPDTATWGLVDSLSLVHAIRLGDPRVLDAVASATQSNDDLDLLAALSGGTAEGLIVHIIEDSGRDWAPAHHFLNACGHWFSASLITTAPVCPATVDDVLSTGRIRLSRSSRSEVIDALREIAKDVSRRVA